MDARDKYRGHIKTTIGIHSLHRKLQAVDEQSISDFDLGSSSWESHGSGHGTKESHNDGPWHRGFIMRMAWKLQVLEAYQGSLEIKDFELGP